MTWMCFPALEQSLDKALAKLDEYLMSPLPDEGHSGESRRKYLDGDELTLADCNLLPKLHVVKVTRFAFVHVDPANLSDCNLPDNILFFSRWLRRNTETITSRLNSGGCGATLTTPMTETSLPTRALLMWKSS